MNVKAKKLLSLVLAFVMVMGMFPATVSATNEAGRFADVRDSDWYADAVRYVSDNGLMVGVDENHFAPGGLTTRGMVVTVLHRMEGEPSAEGTGFTDVESGMWYTEAVLWAQANGIVEGFGDGTFQPNASMTREQMMAVFYRYSQYKGYDVSDTMSLGVFTDSIKIQSYAQDAMAWAVAVGLIQGFPDGTIRPQADSNRAQLATVLMRFCNIGVSNYQVTFVRNDGSAGVYATQQVGWGETVNEPDAPTRELYRFTGWYMESETVTEYDFSAPVCSDLTLYAGWGNPDGSDDTLYAASNQTETVFSVSDITVNGDQVTITYNTNNVALISVEFFDDQMETGAWSEENLNENLALAPITTTAGYSESYGELATITLPIMDELPDYYLIRAMMTDSESNSTEYITAKYTSTYAVFDAQTVDDFDADRVINFDRSNNTNFGVIKESVIVIPAECQNNRHQQFRVEDIRSSVSTQSQDEPTMEELVPDHLFTFPDKNAVIYTGEDGTEFRLMDLAIGDVVYIEGTTWMFKIKTIEENEDGSIAFTQDKNASMIDFYDTLKVDFEGIEADASDIAPQWELIDVDGKGSVTFGPFSLAKEFDNGIELSGSISGSVTGNVKMSYDAHLFAADYFEASFEFTTALTGEVKAEIETGSNPNEPGDLDNEWKNIEFQVDTSEVKLPTPVTGLEIYIKPSAQIDWGLSGDVSITWTSKQVSGFKYNSDTGRTDIKKKENTVSVMAKGKAEAKVGPIVDIGVQLLGGALKGGVVAEAGAKLSAEAEIGADDLLNNVDSKHACGLCVAGSADWYASAYVKCSYKITDNWKGDIVKVQILDFSAPITFNLIPGKFYFSILNALDSPFGGEMKLGGGECPNRTYRTEFITQDSNGQDIEDIFVSVTRNGYGTTKSGKSPYVVYLYEGSYTASATVDGTRVLKNIAVAKDRQNVYLRKGTVNAVLEGSVVDANTKAAINGVTVKVSKGDVVLASVETDTTGKFSVPVPNDSVTVEFTKDGYLTFTSTETVHEGDSIHYMGQVELTPGSGMGGFRGVIRDAVTNLPIEDVTLNLYKGWNNPGESNTALRTLKTNRNGEFRYDTVSFFGNIIGLPSGNYTLIASKEGYSETSFNIVVYPGATDDSPAINETLSPEMDEGFYRIILTWGRNPSDLDSHLVANTDTGSSIHVAYYDKEPWPYYANLDLDDTDYEGPETITITNFEGLSNIRYAVHDFSNRHDNPSQDLSNSGAVVRIYKGNTLLRTFNVPTGYGGTEWDVFSLEADGTIVAINTMKYTESPEYVLGGTGTYGITNLDKDYELSRTAE